KAPEVAVYDRGRFWCMTGYRLPGAQLACEPRQEALERLLAKLFRPNANQLSSNDSCHNGQSTGGELATVASCEDRKPTGNGHHAGSWFDRMLSDCASAPEGERSE